MERHENTRFGVGADECVHTAILLHNSNLKVLYHAELSAQQAQASRMLSGQGKTF